MTSLNSGIFIGAFLSSGVEFLEIVAIAYALAASGYRREALFGSAAGILGVTLAGALLGPELIFVPLRWLQLGAGLVLLYFGWKWTKKSVVRHAGGKRAGWIQNPLRGRILETEHAASRFSYINFAVMTKCAALETFEVALIVITIGLSSRAWIEALSGALTRFSANRWSRRRPPRLFTEIAGRFDKIGSRTHAPHAGYLLVS
jgi:Ca2+/H+ antiporter, TMEM165/GDT1 family